MLRSSSFAPTAALFALCLSAPGCVQRTINITSDPPGALVFLNDREVGRTPVDVDFVHYGTYDVRLIKEGYEPLPTFGDAVPPLWDNVGLDLAAELIPAQFESNIHWHYVLIPANDDRDDLLDRARQLRAQSIEQQSDEAAPSIDETTAESSPPPEAGPGESSPTI